MKRIFNTTGLCVPEKHYMVDLSKRIDAIIANYIEPGKYFVINRGRQYGKTTTLAALQRALEQDYIVLSISFEAADGMFDSERSFAEGFLSLLGERLRCDREMPKCLVKKLLKPICGDRPFETLSKRITNFCKAAPKPVVLIIDEVDKSSDNDLFVLLLALLRDKYLRREVGKDVTFTSVILAGLYDVKSLKFKIRPDAEHKYNSPWNIAKDFDMPMWFNSAEITGMLTEYESDRQTGMNVAAVAQEIFDWTSGYPVLVSYICSIIDERLVAEGEFADLHSAWTHEGVECAAKMLTQMKIPLFDSMVRQLDLYPKLRRTLKIATYGGEKVPYSANDADVGMGIMFAFLKKEDGYAVISNRIFEVVLQDMFITEDVLAEDHSGAFAFGSGYRSEFTKGGRLDMDKVLSKFVEYYTDVASGEDERFVEAQGRKMFMLYMKPILNGKGNLYIEPETRDARRADLVVDYKAEQFVIEMKIWRGNAYNERGEEQLAEYLDYYHLKRGYLVSFCFNKNKTPGVRTVTIGDRSILEAVV